MKKSEDLEGKVWQYFTVVPDFKSTGIKDEEKQTGKRASF